MLGIGKQGEWSTKYQLQDRQLPANCRCGNANLKLNVNDNLIRLLKVPDDAIYVSHPG